MSKQELSIPDIEDYSSDILNAIFRGVDRIEIEQLRNKENRNDHKRLFYDKPLEVPQLEKDIGTILNDLAIRILDSQTTKA